MGCRCGRGGRKNGRDVISLTRRRQGELDLSGLEIWEGRISKSQKRFAAFEKYRARSRSEVAKFFVHIANKDGVKFASAM